MQGYQIIDDDDDNQPRGRLAPNSEPQTFCPDTFSPDQVLITQADQKGTRWSHIVDLDEFFTRVYEYHRRHGFLCILISDCFELFRFLFVVVFAGFLFSCVDYDILFKRKLPTTFNYTFTTKTSLADAILEDCPRFNWVLVVCMLIALIFWLYRLIVTAWKITQSYEVKKFYQNVLKIAENEIDNLTWHEVIQKLRDAQTEYHFCIHKTELTELDVYHRILRRKNYLVAMVNKGLLPPKFRVPLIGDVCFFTNGFKFNYEFLFFLGWWSPWQDYWRLKADYKKREKVRELTQRTENVIFWLAFVNLVFSPVVFVWQIFYSFFSYGELIKREPGSLGVRRWSIYGKYFFRHFNELDHELENRLSRGYKPAVHYLEMFSSSLLEILAKNIVFFLGAPLIVLVILSVYDEDVLQVEHVLTVITVFGLIIAISRLLIPDENLVWCPELMMNAVCAQVHYLPDAWKSHSHTEAVRKEFSQMFQYTATFLFEELFSPLVTPFILLFWLKPHCHETLEFFRKFTIEVPGLGDVCSFAQMDVQKHGDPNWQPPGPKKIEAPEQVVEEGVANAADCGKTEMSLMHFTITNPLWHPPTPAAHFLENFRHCANHDMQTICENQALFDNPLVQSLSSITTPFASPLFGAFTQQQSHIRTDLMTKRNSEFKGRGVSRAEGPLNGGENGILASIRASSIANSTAYASTSRHGLEISSNLFSSPIGVGASATVPAGMAAIDGAAAEMSLTTLYLRELHQRKIRPKLVTYGSLHFRDDSSTNSREMPSDLWSVPKPPVTEYPGLDDAPDIFDA